MKMKKILSLVFFAIAIISALPNIAKADAPLVTVLEPTGTVYVPGFPASLQLKFSIKHNDLTTLQSMKIDITGPAGDVQTIVDSTVGNPFPTGVGCNFSAISCVVGGDATLGYTATIAVPWIAPQPGTYTMTVAIRHRGAEGLDEETVTLVLMTVEYPAPPAIANAYINDKGYKLTAKRRGCVISRIAAGHTVEAYGNRGGPYDNPKIYADVESFLNTVCP